MPLFNPDVVIEHVKTMIQLSNASGPKIYKDFIEVLKASPTLGADKILNQYWDQLKLVEISRKVVSYTVEDGAASNLAAPSLKLSGGNNVLPDNDPLLDHVKTFLVTRLAEYTNVTNSIIFAQTIGIEKFNAITDEAVIYLES